MRLHSWCHLGGPWGLIAFQNRVVGARVRPGPPPSRLGASASLAVARRLWTRAELDTGRPYATNSEAPPRPAERALLKEPLPHWRPGRRQSRGAGATNAGNAATASTERVGTVRPSTQRREPIARGAAITPTAMPESATSSLADDEPPTSS